MECIIFKNKIFLIGKSSEIVEYLKEKAKTCKTIKEIIVSKNEVYNDS